MNALSSATAVIQRHVMGTNQVDEWGMDEDAVALAHVLAALRWSATVTGAAHVPASGPALLVANRRPLDGTPLLVAATIGRATGRPVRFTGIVDIAPAGPLLRRTGGVVARPDEVAGLLRAGELAAVWCSSTLLGRPRIGLPPAEYLNVALDSDAPVLPVAVIAGPVARRVEIAVGAPLATESIRGPLATAELADAARLSIQRMIDESAPGPSRLRLR